MSDFGWVPVTERLPEDLEEVIITWVNPNPPSYYESIKGVPFTGAAVFYNEDWYWYSSTTQDILAEYGECEGERIRGIEITAWAPFQEPYKEESEDEAADD